MGFCESLGLDPIIGRMIMKNKEAKPYQSLADFGYDWDAWVSYRKRYDAQTKRLQDASGITTAKGRWAVAPVVNIFGGVTFSEKAREGTALLVGEMMENKETAVTMPTYSVKTLQMVSGKKVLTEATGITKIDMPGWIRARLAISSGMLIWIKGSDGAETKSWASLQKEAPLGYVRAEWKGAQPHPWEDKAIVPKAVALPTIEPRVEAKPVLAMAKAEVGMPTMLETLVEKNVSEMTLEDFRAYYASEQSDVKYLSWTVMVPNPQAAVVVAPTPTPMPKADRFAVAAPAPKKVRGKKANNSHGEVKVTVPVEDGNQP